MFKIICPNKNDPAWKRLAAAIGENRAYLAFFRNDNVIPDVKTARAKLGLKDHVDAANLALSDYLNAVHSDWLSSQNEFARNTRPKDQWPIPFFGNLNNALVATVGVNPSSTEFSRGRRWDEVRTKPDWETRLTHYFDGPIPPHEWFEPWREGLDIVGVSYEKGTAAHCDVSYRSTTAMLDNDETDPKEFRRMVERDAQWLFSLLPIYPKLRGLLILGPIIRGNGRPEALAGFVRRNAPQHGFTVLNDGNLQHTETGKTLFIHAADTFEEKGETSRVVKNLHTHRDALLRMIAQ